MRRKPRQHLYDIEQDVEVRIPYWSPSDGPRGRWEGHWSKGWSINARTRTGYMVTNNVSGETLALDFSQVRKGLDR